MEHGGTAPGRAANTSGNISLSDDTGQSRDAVGAKRIIFQKKRGRPIEKKGNLVLSATNEHEECSQDGDRGHHDQGDAEQPVSALCGGGDGAVLGDVLALTCNSCK